MKFVSEGIRPRRSEARAKADRNGGGTNWIDPFAWVAPLVRHDCWRCWRGFAPAFRFASLGDFLGSPVASSLCPRFFKNTVAIIRHPELSFGAKILSQIPSILSGSIRRSESLGPTSGDCLRNEWCTELRDRIGEYSRATGYLAYGSRTTAS